MRSKRAIHGLVLATTVFGLMQVPAAAQTAGADFYRDNAINLIIGFPGGGGYDIYGRMVSRHLGKHIPGAPKVVPQNMIGAGGMKAANFMYGVAPKDGTTLGIIPDTTPSEELLGTNGVAYVSQNFNWIGRISASTNVQVLWAPSGVKTIEDARTKESVQGGSGPMAPAVIYPKLLNALGGTKFKMVTGYGGAAESCLAMEKGEIDGCLLAWSTVKAAKRDWLENKKAHIIVQWGATRHPELPNVATILELAKDDRQREILRLIFAQSQMGRVIMGPPAMPKAMVEAHRAAFDRALKDPEFLADVEKMRLEISGPMTGVEVDQLVGSLYRATPERIKEAGVLLGGN